MNIERIKEMMDVEAHRPPKIAVVKVGEKITLSNEWGTGASGYSDFYEVVRGFGKVKEIKKCRNCRQYGDPGDSSTLYIVEETPVIVRNSFCRGYTDEYRRTIRFTIYVTAEEAVDLEFMTAGKKSLNFSPSAPTANRMCPGRLDRWLPPLPTRGQMSPCPQWELVTKFTIE